MPRKGDRGGASGDPPGTANGTHALDLGAGRDLDIGAGASPRCRTGTHPHSQDRYTPSTQPSQAHPVQNSPGTRPSQAHPVQNSPGTPEIPLFGAFCANRESFVPLPPPPNRAGRKKSRTKTPPQPSNAHLPQFHMQFRNQSDKTSRTDTNRQHASRELPAKLTRQDETAPQRPQRQATFARNLRRSFFAPHQKRCNSNDATSTCERVTEELRAKLPGPRPARLETAARPRGGRTSGRTKQRRRSGGATSAIEDGMPTTPGTP